MNLEIKKNLASNWFKTLQEALCEDINKLEKNSIVSRKESKRYQRPSKQLMYVKG